MFSHDWKKLNISISVKLFVCLSGRVNAVELMCYFLWREKNQTISADCSSKEIALIVRRSGLMNSYPQNRVQVFDLRPEK